MKVLFLHTNTPDYLASGLFHGLRSVLGKDCLDLPRYDCMYKPYSTEMRSKIRGNGFTLYGLLDDIPGLDAERFFIWYTNIKDYDLYIIANIWDMWDTYKQLLELVPAHKIIVIDPIDTSRIFPFNNYFAKIKENPLKLLSSIHPLVKYFKRELGESLYEHTGFNKILFEGPFKKILPKSLYPISFSIPLEKIIKVSPATKSQLFVSNIVDKEIHEQIPNSFFTALGKEEYKFDSEEAYYSDIQISRYGITTKRSGWDCLRHYEYAANGTVLCFKQLEIKPLNNAPHGLSKRNCIIYSNYTDLMEQIEKISDKDYEKLLEETYSWAIGNSTVAAANRLLTLALD